MNNKGQQVSSFASEAQPVRGEAAVDHLDGLRAKLLRGGRLAKFKGILASIAPTLAGVALAAGVAAAPAMAVTVNNPTGPVSETVNNDDVNITNVGTIDATSGHAINVVHTGTGNVKVTSTPTGSITAQATGGSGVRIDNRGSATGSNVNVNVNDVTANTGGGTAAAIDVVNNSIGGATDITATGTITNNSGHAIRINAVDGAGSDGPLGGSLTINTKDLVSGTRAAGATFTTGGGEGIQLVGAVGSTAAPQATMITTGDIDATKTGVNLAFDINRVDGATTIKTGNITAGGEGVAIDSNDDANNYLISVTTGDVTTGGSGIVVNNSGTGGITVKTGNVNAGTATAGTVNGIFNAGGYGIRMDSDAHGTTTAGTGGADWNLTAGNVTVKDGTGALTGTGVGLGTIFGGGNGNTTATVGDIQAGTGLIYNRAGTGAVNLTTGDITASTGNGIQYGTNIVQNDLVIKTGDINAASQGITGDTAPGTGVTTITTDNITAGSNGINVIHSGTGAATINTGDVTSTGGQGIVLTDDAASFNADATIGGVTVTTGNVDAASNAINVTAQVKQTPTVITANGAVTSTGGQGIVVNQSNTGTGAGDVTVTANKAVTAAGNGINVSTAGLGDTTVQANDAVTGTGGYGVYLSKSGDGNASIDTKGAVTARTGISLANVGVGDGTIHAEDLVNATAGTGIQVTGFNNGDLSVAADQGVTATGNGIDLGGSVNGGANVGTVKITAGGDIKAGVVGINGDTGGSTTGTTINVADMDTGSTGLNWINSGTKPFTFTSTGTINAGGIGINVTTDSASQNPGGVAANPDSETIINVNNITTPNERGVYVVSNAAKGTTINTTGAITTLAANTVAGDGIWANEGTGPLTVNVGKGSVITSYNNTLDLFGGSAGTTVNVDGKLVSTTDQGGGDGVLWIENTPGTTTININDGSTVQAKDVAGYAVTAFAGDSKVTVAKTATVQGGFRLGAGNDALTFNGTNMTNVGTLDGGSGSTYATGGAGDVLTLNDVSNFTRNLQTAGQEIENWDQVALNGGTADLQGTMTTGQFTLGKDAAGNPATLAIGAGTAGNNLTITGDYVGAGGDLALDADAASHTADKLVVGGNVSGLTGVTVNDLTPAGSPSDKTDIEVVDVAGTSPAGAFVLANGPNAVMGGQAYQLQQGSFESGTTTIDPTTVKNWYLAVQPCPAGGLTSVNGYTLGCKTPDTLTVDGTKTVDGNFEGAGGADTLVVSGGATVTGIVAGGNVGADSSAPQDTDDNILIDTTGSVGGVQGNLGHDTIYVVGKSAVNGDVQGNEGDDDLVIGGNGQPQTPPPPPNAPVGSPTIAATDSPTITGDVQGNAGNDRIWVLGGAHVTGNVDGDSGTGSADTGDDTLVLNGATAQVDGNVDAGNGDNKVLLQAGTVGGNVTAGTGDDMIALSGATVNGANGIDAGDGANTVTLNSGSANSVTTGSGNDTIGLQGATIAGLIDAGAGNDIVDISGGSADSVHGGDGNDTITQTGGSVTGANTLSGGAGDDAIDITGGTDAHVTGDGGNDTITLNGGNVTGAIEGGDGNDTIALKSGQVATVTGGTGDDAATWDVGNVTGVTSIDLGDGSDTLALSNASGGFGATTLDGGDDASTADGMIDTLNLDGVKQTLVSSAQIVNFENVDLTNGSVLTMQNGQTLTTGLLSIDSASQLVARGGGSGVVTVGGDVANLGTIDMQDGKAGDQVSVTGNYSGGGALKIDADLAADKADTLQVGGTVSGAKTTLNVQNVTPKGQLANGKDVEVAQAGGAIDAKDFSLAGGPITSGIYDYGLANGTAPDTVVLHGTLNATGALYSAAIGSLADTFGRLPTLEQRVGQRQWLARGNGGFFDGAWLRISGDHATTTPATSAVDFSTYNDSWGAQVGIDFTLLNNADGRLTAGITGQYKGMNADVRAKAGEGGIRAHGGGGGINVTWNGVHGEYADVQAQYNKVYATLSTDRTGITVDGLSADSKSASLEIGKRFVVSADGRNVLVPQAQISWGLFSTDPFTDSNNIAVDLGTEETAVARMGLAYEFHPDGIDLRDPNKDGKMFYAIFNVLQDLSPRTSSQAQGRMLDTLRERTWGQIGVGGSLAMSDNVLIYGEVGYRASFQELSNTRNNGVGGTIGVRVGW